MVSDEQTRRVGFYEDQVLPRVIEVVCNVRPLRPLRERVVRELDGKVLEVGFGSGSNVPYYPTSVTRVLAVDPATVGRKLAAQRVAASPVPVEYIGLDGQDLPLDDDSVDHVLTTWTLCTIPDVEQALREMRRVLRPGGALHFLEHGRAPDPRVARLQDRFNGLEQRIAGGCNLNRPIDRLISDAGFRIDRLDRYYARGGPRILTSMYEGIARTD